ncbi:phosphoenolpyruvate carboxykinase [Lentilactobacillus sp. SPB1-3]|uniref:Phosphoenolpyruvate carboxykinase n=1 Tax=Lentilactobacillus terminaliae TaxID=3003483 RepID=A0ACD5DF37_9LACO|nr:phosphoenolpyruvate carboxykinase [Lentilactobacillus sp. SPB1-3]MCZ0976525.1 phosphoenolpyruvate carboxykinase [Lentilactobacillus sp. SPB1-3]
MVQEKIDTAPLYVNPDRGVAVLNYSSKYIKDLFQLVNSEELAGIVKVYLNDNSYKKTPSALNDVSVEEYVGVIKDILMNHMDSLKFASTDILNSIEDLYTYYRSLLRISTINKHQNAIIGTSFMNIDNRFNELVLNLYRSVEEKLQGHVNHIYRQVDAGTNACILTQTIKWDVPEKYASLASIRFIDTLMVRPPVMVHTKSNKREGVFSETKQNPIENFKGDRESWYCYPAWVGESLAYIYFDRDYFANGLALGNLFELADEEAVKDRKPDIILLFGSEGATSDTDDNCHYFLDAENDIYVGQVPYNDKTTYFGYMKKMVLTLHNLSMISKHKLPIHGSMVKITFSNGKTKSVVFFGDSGAGKSESIEALQEIADDKIENIETIFDDMGSFTLTGDEQAIYAQGTETGAFVRLDDLSSEVAFSNMDRGIYMNPELSNARCIIPANTYQNIVKHHNVDMWLYANNYDKEIGVHQFDDEQEAKSVFVAGKRKALGTTDEVGMSITFFANPFGPVQKQAETQEIIDEVFPALFKKGTFIGEIYTHLGYDKKKSSLNASAQALLDILMNS